jgi:hypothetical protein
MILSLFFSFNFCLVFPQEIASLKQVLFHFELFRFVSFRWISFRFVSISFRILQVPNRKGGNSVQRAPVRECTWSSSRITGTCFIQKIYAPSSSLLQGNICSLPLSHFASIFFVYLWSFRWPNYIVTLPRYFSFRLPHLNINTGPPSAKVAFSIFQSLKRIQSLSVRSKLI